MIKPKFTKSSLHAYTMDRAKKIEAIITRWMVYLGEQAVNVCREQHNYIDQTGNLTSSIGYQLYIKGVPYKKNFEAFVGGSEDGSEGISKGQALALELGPLGSYTLILVAGMEYAEEVEARGKNVLSPGYLYLENELPKVKLRIIREVNSLAA